MSVAEDVRPVRRRKRPAHVADPRAGKSPAEQLRESLQRHKAVGLPFDEAWRQAWLRVRWPHGRELREEWQAILSVGRHVWRRAYEDEAERTPARATRGLHAV